VARTLRLEKLEVRGGRALLTFAPSTGVAPGRLITLLRSQPKRVKLVREFVVQATVPAAPWSDTHAAVMKLLGELA
jgi:hypothetical protein